MNYKNYPMMIDSSAANITTYSPLFSHINSIYEKRSLLRYVKKELNTAMQ